MTTNYRVLRCLAILALGVSNGGLASQFTVTQSGVPYARHWDEWVFIYTPGFGWSQQLVSGNADGSSGTLKVLADSGTSAQTVNLRLYLDLQITTKYLPAEYLAPFMDGYADAFGNFAGMTDGTLSNSFWITSDGFAAAAPAAGASRAFLDNGAQTLTAITPFIVGTVPPFGSDPVLELGFFNHNLFSAVGPDVFDETKSAAFAIQGEMVITATGAEIVPDHGLTIGLIGSALASLFWLRHRGQRRSGA